MSGKEAFAIDGLEYVKGDKVVLGESPVVFECWATWCPPCVKSIPHLTEVAHRHPKVRFLGVTNEPASTAKPFVTRMGAQMDYSVACDSRGVSAQYMQAFGAQGIPFACIIGKDKKMRWAGHPMDPQFESEIQKAEAEAAASEKPKVVLRNETEASLRARGVKELKAIAHDNHVDISQCLEKDEIVAKLLLG